MDQNKQLELVDSFLTSGTLQPKAMAASLREQVAVKLEGLNIPEAQKELGNKRDALVQFVRAGKGDDLVAVTRLALALSVLATPTEEKE